MNYTETTEIFCHKDTKAPRFNNKSDNTIFNLSANMLICYRHVCQN